MSKKGKQVQDRDGIVASLLPWSRGRIPPPAGSATGTYVAPSRKYRKALTTWQDEATLKMLRDIAHQTGISQQALIAEGLNYVLMKYRRQRTAAR